MSLSLTNSIIRGDSNCSKFSAIEIFDDYFHLGGRKYKIIKPDKLKDSRITLVEEINVKSNKLLNFLKIVSYCTGFIPLIMLIGKVLARSHYVFSKHLISESVKESVIQNLKEYGLTNEEFEKIEDYYYSHLEEFTGSQPINIKKNESLPRSLVYIPSGKREGLYIKLKSKGGVEELGKGAYNRATKILWLKNGATRVFRSGKYKKDADVEQKINSALEKEQNKNFAAGVSVLYKGTFSSRDKKQSKNEREINVDKIGYVMDLYGKGDLSKLIYSKKSGRYLEHGEAFRIGTHIAAGLVDLHEKNYVHYDLKPENIFMDENNCPKITDFNLSRLHNEACKLAGSYGYVPPEIARRLSGKECSRYCSDKKADIWSFGCVLAEMLYGKAWYEWTEQKKDHSKWEKVTWKNAVNKKKAELLKYKNNPRHLDYIIDKCLTVDPEQRPSAKEVLAMFRKRQKEL